MPVDHYENFPVASWLLPPHLRHPIEVIYAFARSADDFADEGDLTPTERIARLSDYSHELDLISAESPSNVPLFNALGEVIRKYALPISLFHDLLNAFRQDVTKTRYANFADLMDYCRRSADPIGRLLLHLNHAATPQNCIMSDAICSALQLINHWQDVAIDWQKNDGGRVYLPQDELRQFGLSDEDIAHKNVSPAWQKMMRFQSQRARELLHSGLPLGRVLPGRMGAELRVIVAGGARILDKIDWVNGDVFFHRPQMNKWDWLRVAPIAIISM